MRRDNQQVYKLWDMMLPTNDFLQKRNSTNILDARAQTVYWVNLRKRSPSLTFAIFKGIKCVSFQKISTKIKIQIFILVRAYMRYVSGKYRNIRISECYRWRFCKVEYTSVTSRPGTTTSLDSWQECWRTCLYTNEPFSQFWSWVELELSSGEVVETRQNV